MNTRMPDRTLADLMSHYELIGSLKHGREFADAVLVYFLGPLRARELIEEHGAGMQALDALAQENEKLGLCGQTEGE